MTIYVHLVENYMEVSKCTLQFQTSLSAHNSTTLSWRGQLGLSLVCDENGTIVSESILSYYMNHA